MRYTHVKLGYSTHDILPFSPTNVFCKTTFITLLRLNEGTAKIIFCIAESLLNDQYK